MTLAEKRLRAEITERILREANLDAQVAEALAVLDKPDGEALKRDIEHGFEDDPGMEWRDIIGAVVDEPVPTFLAASLWQAETADEKSSSRGGPPRQNRRLVGYSNRKRGKWSSSGFRRLVAAAASWKIAAPIRWLARHNRLVQMACREDGRHSNCRRRRRYTVG